jgi:glutamate-1-semialdehyde aminotransferase/spore coat polysaccharide biosynthesis protein SpsF (cytidylyltransferase family)
MVLAIVQARVSSSRLPGKVLLPILNKPMLLRQLERLRHVKGIHKLVVATSNHESDDSIEALCLALRIDCYRGSLNDVLDRYYQAANLFHDDHIVRLTGDCPLSDPALIDHIIEWHLLNQYDYTSNTIHSTYPDGLDVEIFRFSCLQEAWKEAELPSQREHVTPFIHQQPTRYKLGSYKNDIDLSHLRWTVDVQEDFELISKIYQALYPQKILFTTQDILTFLDQHPELTLLNSNQKRNAGMELSLQKDKQFYQEKKIMHKGYKQSELLLSRALKVIPLGAQTYSKSMTQFPFGASPYFLERGKGSHVWDVDGNEYIDFINGLAAITLGYNDPDVTQSVAAQLNDGVIFSLSHPLETAVAEKIIEMVPCAEMVRFGKNGSDATSGAIRLARAYTSREHVAVCGYHGWQDWYIGSTSRDLGVPKSTQQLVHPFIYNDLSSLKHIFEQFPDQIAAVIMEPMNTTWPKNDFLKKVHTLAKSLGALFILDETITGFRFAAGGAQEYFDLQPDLATFGKGVANGYPLSVIAGRRDIMDLMNEIFFSFTFGGETLSLAAALATLNKIQQKPIINTLISQGEKLASDVIQLIQKHKMENIISISGHPTWTFLTFHQTGPYTPLDIKTLWMQEILVRGILSLGTHNISYSHSDEDIHHLTKVYDEIFPIIKEAVLNNRLEQYLHCSPLKPLFKIR